jgi:hypothetical protein
VIGSFHTHHETGGEAMGMPKPGDDHKRLEKLAVTWQGTETMYPSQWDPNGGEAQGTTRGRSALGGFAVVVDYEQTRDGKSTFEGHGVYTWDDKAKEVVLHWFDSMGQGREEFRGSWDGDGERLTLTSRNPMGHTRMLYDFSERGALSSSMEMSQDGQSWSKLFDGRYAIRS